MGTQSTTYKERALIVERFKNGESLESIAEDLRLNFYTVRKWWRQYRDADWESLVSQLGRPANGALADYHPRVKYVALRLKVENPGWGLDVLLLHMSRRASLQGMKLPKRTALYNYLRPYYRRFRPGRPSTTGRPSPEVHPVKMPHQRWQMDFKGEIKVEGVGKVAPLNFCDEFTSAPLHSILYAKRSGHPKSGMTWHVVQQGLRQVFTRWGLPDELRMDRDPIFVGSARFEWPSPLLLWIVGLGVQPIVNPPGKPQYNAEVERMNRTWFEQVGLSIQGCCLREIAQKTEQAWEDRRRYLPTRNPNCKPHPPLKAFPELAHSGRAFCLETEKELFEINRVYDYLEQWKWKRQVDDWGRITFAKKGRKVDKDLKGQMVKVNFNKELKVFCIRDQDGHLLNQLPVNQVIDLEEIFGEGVRLK